MEEAKVKKLFKKLKHKPRKQLMEEKQDLTEEQEILRKKRKELERRKEELTNNLILASKAHNDTEVAVIETQIDILKDDIKEIKRTHKENADILEVYSKVMKNDRDRKNSTIGTVVNACGTAVAAGLAGLSLHKAYKSDLDGTMINKKVLDVFNKLNPFRLIGGGTLKKNN